MPRNTYLYENRLFTNKVRRSTILGEEGKDRVVLIKSESLEESLEGRAI